MLRSHPFQTLLRSLILPLVVLSLFLTACQSNVRVPQETSALNPTSPIEIQHDWYTVYFTDPSDPSSKTYRGGPDKDLAEAIRKARLGVDVAVLQLNLWSVRDALLDAHRRGLRVRVVTESDYLDEREVQQLIEAGIPVIGDRREGLMHNKFAIIDQLEVWTGSMNFTISEGYRNNNTLLRLRSPELAANYLAEFEEMFLDDRFGLGSPSNTPYPELKINDTRIQTCFGPEDGCTERLVRAIAGAENRIEFLAYSFTSDELADALLERLAQGVNVRGVMEASQAASNRGTDLERFLSAGLDVRLDANPDQMHTKVMLIDERITAIGSFNFTYSAETRNDENLLIIEDPVIAKLYLAEFEKLFGQASQLPRGPGSGALP